MQNQSLLGLAVLLLGASCVPPHETAGLGKPRAGMPSSALATALPESTMSRPAAIPQGGPALIGDGAAMPSLAPDLVAFQKTPAQPFAGLAQDGEDGRRALDCLTAAVYYEARSEPLEGQEAVAQVVLNRVRNPAFPNSVCGVVYQGSERGTGCQFTFTCDGSLAYRREPAAWERSRQVAQAALDGNVYTPVGLATNYHTTAILPWWAQGLSRIATIGSQIFYKWRGGLGEATAFNQQYAGSEPGVASQPPASLVSPLAPVTVHYAGRPDAGGDMVAVHRGNAAVTLASAREASAFGVRVHLGPATMSDAAPDAGPQEASAAGVKVHVGAPPQADMPG